MILGMAFRMGISFISLHFLLTVVFQVRNTYTLINFGNLVKGGSSSTDPYVQLVSLTDETAAVNDFINVRLNGQNLVNSSQYALLPASQEQHSPETEAEKKAQYEEEVLSRWPYILSGCLLIVILLVAFCIWRCCCRRKRLAKKKAAKQQTDVGLNVGPYAQLPDSGSTASLVMKPMGASTLESKDEYDGARR